MKSQYFIKIVCRGIFISNQKKKVLIFTPSISGQRAHYYNALSDLCDLTVLSELDTSNDLLQSYNIFDKKFSHIVIDGFKIRINSYQALCFNYKKYLKKYIYDAIIIEQVFTPTAIFIMRYLRKKNIKFYGSADGGIVNTYENKFKFLFKKRLINMPTFWLTSGVCGYKYLNNYGIKNEKIYKFIFSPYDERDLPDDILNKNQKINLKQELNVKENLVILFVGQPIDRKGQDILLNAAADISNDVGLFFVGGGPTNLCLQALDVQKKSIYDSNIHFLGLLSKDNLKKYYYLADIFVFPTRYDIWGYPIQEAMAFGVPIISSDAANAAIELIKDGENGFIFENENVEDLKNKLEILIKDNNLRKKMSINNFNKGKLYTSENMAKSIFDIINNNLE